jgi:hypothetical protein
VDLEFVLDSMGCNDGFLGTHHVAIGLHGTQRPNQLQGGCLS